MADPEDTLSTCNQTVDIDPSPTTEVARRKTFIERLAVFKTWKFWEILLIGQLLSLCITATNVTSEKLGTDYNIAMPTTQTFLNYFILAIVYNSIAIWKRGFIGWLKQIWKRGLVCKYTLCYNDALLSLKNYAISKKKTSIPPYLHT